MKSQNKTNFKAFFVLLTWLAFFVSASNGADPSFDATWRGVDAIKSDPRPEEPSAQEAPRSQETLPSQASQSRDPQGQTSSKPDPWRRDANGVQTYFPAVAKIVGRSPMKTREDGVQTVPFFYGTGSYVAEYESWGLVVTNWHVVSEATEAIDVIFPSGTYPANVVLRDETWDLAALIVRKPLNIEPIPISHEGPRLGDVFWVGGYGQSNGLADFRMESGRLTNFVSLVDPDADEELVANDEKVDRELESSDDASKETRSTRRVSESAVSPLYETLSIKQGVRQGDSGGPIFNRYGELAGILWGSDGKCTMGTSCIRLLPFLTQATREAANLYALKRIESETTGAVADPVTPWTRLPADCPKAGLSGLPAEAAFRAEGFFPASSRSAYVSHAGRSSNVLANMDRADAVALVENDALDYWRKTNGAAPPSPPIFSPSYVVSLINSKDRRPELIDADTFKKLDVYAYSEARKKLENAAMRESKELWASNSSASRSVLSDDALPLELAERPTARLVAASHTPDLPEALNEAAKNVGEAVEDATDALKKDLDAAEITASDALKDAKEAVEDGLNAASKAAEQAAESAKEQLEEAKEKFAGTIDGAVDEASKSADQETEPQSEESPESNGAPDEGFFPRDGGRLSDLKAYVVVICVFCMFCFFMRLSQTGAEASERKKREKRRLREKK